MNKLEGFLELKSLAIPTVGWREYKSGITFDKGRLWTVRCAVMRGDDFNLPRLVGADGERAEKFAFDLKDRLGDSGMVIYYPFFLAEISGTVIISSQTTTLECVYGDLWQLVTDGVTHYTGIFDLNGQQQKAFGERPLHSNDIQSLLKYSAKIRAAYRREIATGKEIYAEWSFARDCGSDGNPVGERNLVFFELRTIGQ